MQLNMEVMRPYLGHWVHCHSIYGVHRGIITQLTEHGIILSRFVQLASAPAGAGVGGTQTAQTVPYHPTNNAVRPELQFFPAPVPVPVPTVPGGLFVPYSGMYGVYPFRPGFPW